MNLDQVIVALDDVDGEKNRLLMDLIKGTVSRVKIGSVAFSSQGFDILDYACKQGFSVFLDLKFHDIPNTVSKSIVGICKRFPVEMLTIHALGGSAMVQAAKEAALQCESVPKTIAVTILTSMDQKQVDLMGWGEIQTFAMQLAQQSVKAGADGLVCSAFEVAALKKECGDHLVYITPGIRLENDDIGDQKRIATPTFAMAQGATHLVMGRSITDASDPFKALQKIHGDA